MPPEINPQFPSELPEFDPEHPGGLPLVSDAYNLGGNPQFCSFGGGAGFRLPRVGRFFRPMMRGGFGGGCGGGGCFLPNQGAYRLMDQMRHQPQQQIWQQIRQILGPIFQELRTFIQNLSRQLGHHGPDAQQRPVTALPPVQLENGSTLHRYSNGDYAIVNSSNRITSAGIGNAVYRQAPGENHWTVTRPGQQPQDLHGTLVRDNHGVRFIPAAPAPPQITDGPQRVNGPNGTYSFTYTNGDSIVYNAQNQPTLAVIDGHTYRPVPNRPGHWLISSDNPTAVPGPVAGHLERTPQGIRFVRDGAPVPYQPLQLAGPPRVNGADGTYSYTYTNGDSIAYNSQNQVVRAVIAGNTYERWAEGLYYLTNSAGVGQGARLGRFERTPQGIRFIPAPVNPNPPLNPQDIV